MAFLFPKSFPFCIAPEEETKDIPVGSGTQYPIGMNLADAMFFYWKNKTFSSIVNLTGTAIVDMGFDPSGEKNIETFTSTYFQSGVLELATNNWPNKMSEMICGSYAPFYDAFAIGTGSITGAGNLNGSTLVQLFIYDIIFRDKKYYPYIGIFAGISASTSGFTFGVFLYSILPEPPYGLNIPIQIPDAFKININGTEYKADLFVVVNVTDLPAPLPTASFVLNGLIDRETE
jgi:hypothetical protein